MQNIKLTDKEIITIKTKNKIKGARGQEGSIYFYRDEGKTFALKLFTATNPNILENKEKKIMILNKKPLSEGILKPIKTVSNNDQIIGYTQQLIWPHQTFFDLKTSTKKTTKIEYLQQAKQLIEELHDNNIIHGDIRSFNLLVQNNKVKICDIDNCIVNDLNSDLDGWCKKLYKQKFGSIDSKLDIFCFNLVTIAVLKNIFDIYAINYIKNSSPLYKDIYQIYQDMNNINSNYTGEYLIDHINKKTKIKLI